MSFKAVDSRRLCEKRNFEIVTQRYNIYKLNWVIKHLFQPNQTATDIELLS